MEYELTITRNTLNPAYSEKQDSYREREPQYLKQTSLAVTISPEQFEAIRKAVIEKF